MLQPAQYKAWLHDEVFLPVIVVVGTEAAKAQVRAAHGLSLAELFGPFGGHFRSLSVSYEVQERIMQVDGLRVRFADAESATQWTAVHAEQVSSGMVKGSAPLSVAKHMQVAKTPPSPWFEQWRLAMFRSLRWSEHEGLDQPVAALIAISSKEDVAALSLEQWPLQSQMPPLCAQGVLEPRPARVAVILHELADSDAPSEDDLQRKFEQVQARVTPDPVYVLKIGRGAAGDPDQGIQELFRPYLSASGAPPPPPPPPQGGEPAEAAGGAEGDTVAERASGGAVAVLPGGRLLVDDLEAVSQVAADIVTKCAMPWLEQLLNTLETQISQSRKGFKNQLKYYLWRKPRESSGGTASQPQAPAVEGPHTTDNGSIYPLQSVEGQMRRAGDVAFLLRDYETALNYYRNVVGDFKQDKSWKHAAGAYEMWGVCLYITGAPRTEWTRCMESAYDHYLQQGVYGARHAVRSAVLHQAMVCDYKEAAARLMKVNADIPDTGLRSALTFEQAGQFYHQAGWARKGAFHLVLAGHTFNKLGFKCLALCCYQAVVSQYAPKQWLHITDHAHFTMARQAFGLGLMEDSLNHFLTLLNSFTMVDKRVCIQADREATYVKEFQYVVQNWVEKCCPADASRVIDLRLPCIGQRLLVLLPVDMSPLMSSPLPAQAGAPAGSPRVPPPPPPLAGAGVGAGGGGGAPAAEAAAVEAPASPTLSWEKLGEKVLPKLSTDERAELDWRSSRIPRAFDALRRLVAVGAEVFLEIELSNPLRVRIDLTNARLGGDLVDETLAGAGGSAPSTCSPPSASKPQPAAKVVDASAPSEVSTDLGTVDDVPAEVASELGTDGAVGGLVSGAVAVGTKAFAEAPAVDFPTQSFSLEPLETRTVRFAAIPRREGLLTLRRLQWSAFGQVLCDRPLSVRGRRLRATAEQRASRAGVYGPDRRLELRVRASMPQLQARIEGWPSSSQPLLLGELRSCALVIRGELLRDGADLVGLQFRAACSHPGFVAFAPPVFDGGVDSPPGAASGSGSRMRCEGEVLTVGPIAPASGSAAPPSELRMPFVLRADRHGWHQVRFCILAEAPDPAASAAAGAGAASIPVPAPERRQWMTLEENLMVRSSLSCTARGSPSFREANCVVLSCSLESRAVGPTLQVVGVRCVAPGVGVEVDRPLALEERAPSKGGALRLPPGHSAQLLFALKGGEEDQQRPDAERLARQRLLRCSRASAATVPGGFGGSSGGALPSQEDRVDLIVEWRADGDRQGEVFAHGILCERAAPAAPCPLDIHVLAPESAVLAADLTLPVTLRVRNASSAGVIAFYFVADPGPELVWLGCERSEVIRLPPLAVHSVELHAYFAAPGVFNVNRFRCFVVSLPPGASTVPASEQAPIAVTCQAERLVHVRPSA